MCLISRTIIILAGRLTWRHIVFSEHEKTDNHISHTVRVVFTGYGRIARNKRRKVVQILTQRTLNGFEYGSICSIPDRQPDNNLYLRLVRKYADVHLYLIRNFCKTSRIGSATDGQQNNPFRRGARLRIRNRTGRQFVLLLGLHIYPRFIYRERLFLYQYLHVCPNNRRGDNNTLLYDNGKYGCRTPYGKILYVGMGRRKSDCPLRRSCGRRCCARTRRQDSSNIPVSKNTLYDSR